MKAILKKLFCNENNNIKSIIARLLMCVCCGIIMAGMSEAYLERRLLTIPKEQQVKKQVDFLQVEREVVIDLPAEYVDKIDYTYEADTVVDADIFVVVPGAGDDFTVMHGRDNNSRLMHESIHKIGFNTNRIIVRFDEDTPATVTSVYIDNVWDINYPRMIIIFFAVFSALFVLMFPSIIRDRLEVAFVVIALMMGLSYIILTPAHKSTWDEGAHFGSSYKMSFEKTFEYDEVIETFINDRMSGTIKLPQTYEEKKLMDATINYNADYGKGHEYVNSKESSKFKFSSIGYIFPMLGISLGRFLKLDFSDIYTLGKIFNLLLYIIVVYFALKRSMVAKRLMLWISLMPTVIITAATYSRDATLNAFSLLGISYILAEFAEDDKYITWKNYLIIMISIFIASCVKPIYAPLAFLVIFLPKKKFKNKKTLYIMKFGVLVSAMLIMASFIVPSTSPTTSIGDSRGGNNISGARQLRFIFSNPVFYTRLLLKNIYESLLKNTMATNVFGIVGYWGVVANTELLTLVTAGIACTDKNEDCDRKITPFLRLVMLGISFVIMCFIWTSMYLSFTEVGVNVINGVQGRYYIPIIIPTLLLLNTTKFQCKFDKRIYNTVIFLLTILIQYGAIYDFILIGHAI